MGKPTYPIQKFTSFSEYKGTIFLPYYRQLLSTKYNWTYADLRCFRPAFSKLLASLQELYPDATIYTITNGDNGIPDLTRPYAKSIEKVCKHYDVTNIVLKDIEKTDGHPTYKGMQSICEQVYEVVRGS